MKGKSPFNAQFVTEKVDSAPDPIVDFLDTVETKSGKSTLKIEVPKNLNSAEYNLTHPLTNDEVSLQDLLDAGVSLNEVPTKIYEEDVTQKDILNMVETELEKQNKDED